MKSGLLAILLVLFVSCSRELPARPYSYVSVRYNNDEEDIFMETTSGSWDAHQQLAQLTATGYHFEQFNLYLQNPVAGSYVTVLSLRNISFSRGIEFVPSKLAGGYIHIAYIDSATIKGDFNVLLEDELKGGGVKTLTGRFGINVY